MNADARLDIEDLNHGDLKRAMGCFATGIAVVTTRHGGVDLGMTCNSFNTVSLEPPLVLWSVRSAAASHDAFVNGGGYTVSILGADQQDIADRFTRGSQAERFAGVPVTRLSTGRLVVDGVAAWMDCSLEKVVRAGDHDILIGRVLEFASTPKDTLGYLRGRFMKLRS